MFDNVVCERPSVTYAAVQRTNALTCHSTELRTWHVLGSLPCDSKYPSCSSHYGLCLPVSTQVLDSKTLIGVLDVDLEAIKEILSADRSTHSSLALQRPSSSSSSNSFNPKSASSKPDATVTTRTVAELATPKRVGHLTSGPNTPSQSPSQLLKSSPRNSAVNLFSIELMQTDDVSTIAAQIANQAELIYQAWKTTDLNPAELIHYHSVSSERSSPFRNTSPFQNSNSPLSPSSSTSSVPRISARSISPAPPGSSPAVPRRVIDIPISTSDRTPIAYQKQQQPALTTQPQQSPQHYIQQQSQKQFQQSPPQKQYQPQQQYQQQQQPSPQQPYHQQPNVRQQPQQQPHASSPVRSLNASPRPYISPSNCSTADFTQSSPQSPRILFPSPSLTGGSAELQSPRHFGSSRMPSLQPPAPPERSSSYVEVPTGTSPQQSMKSSPPKDIEMLGNPDLEASLRELVTNFVMEDKARLASTRDRPKSSPSSIQDALQRFERQMAITSRVANDPSQTHDPSDSTFTLNPVNTDRVLAPINVSHAPTFSSPKKDPSITDGWGKRESEGRARRSISPSPPMISQPGWNEPPPSNTSTWPLKNKQFSSPEKRSSAEMISSLQHSTANHSPSSKTMAPSVVVSPQTNYITTLEAHVDSQGRTPGIPIRHKVITMSGVNRDEDMTRPFKKISQDEVDSFRPKDARPSSPNVALSNATSSINRGTSAITSVRKPKYTISVTVDVENKAAASSPEPPPMLTNHDAGSQSWQIGSGVENLSTVDYAKVRFQDAQQRPKTAQRLEDYKTYSSKTTVNADGRVLQAKSKFEVGNSLMSSPYQEAPWRTAPAGSSLTNEVGSTLPEFYRRKLRKMRKPNSPEPYHALAALPHPELTDQQKAHIRERSQFPTAALGGNIVVRPFLTQGSVAERVLLFEKAPTELKKTSPPTAAVPDQKRPASSTWRDPDEVRSKAQETIPSPPSPPRQQLEALPSSAPTITANTSKQSHLREPITSIANKENARPTHCASSHVSSTPTTIHNHPTSQSALSSTHNATSPLGLGVHVGLGSSPPSLSTNNRTASRRLTKTPKNLLIPRFYYPMGRPHQSQEEALECVSQCFRDQGGQISRENMEPLMRVCDIPLYWKAPLFIAAGGEKLGYLTQEQFSDYWERVISTCHDVSSRFVRVLSRGLRNYLLPEDFLSLIQDVVDTHPGLTFLKEATEFHSRYVHTVIARIYYCVNRSWSGKITIPEIRRSNLLQVISYLEEEEDINKITDYFSYEHFYVIYCKFWELDTDHDLFIDRNDLAKHNERALSDKIIDRIFSGAVTRGRVQKQDRMGYQEFVWFLISEEDKRHPTAIEYWFRCMDIDGDGFLSMYELEYFYEDQLQRMEALGIETLPYTDCLCQMLDMVRPSVPGKISLSDLKKCRMTTVFFDTFFNFDKYLDHEQRDPFASHRMDDDGPEISDWDRYAAEEYELLVAEEGGGDPQDDMLYGDEDELSMGVDNALDADGLLGPEFGVMGKDLSGMGIGGSLNKHSSLSATVPNLAIDHMDVDEDYSDYADSDDYQY